ncbi:class I tRNA ligase family protein, partial [Acinetobacter baumannii]
YKADTFPREYAEGFVKLLAPIAPHMMEELWAMLGHDDSISYVDWPTFDPAALIANEVEVIFQVNGKLKAKVTVAKDTPKEELEAMAKA